MAHINKVGHVVLSVKDVMTLVEFYSKALGMEVVDLKEDHRMAFLSFGTQHHDIALFQAQDGAERGGLGLNHVAMQIEGGLPELRLLKARLEEYGGVVTGTTDHTITKSVYFQDPDGNRLEIFAEGFEDPGEALDFIRTGAGRVKPLELEEAAAG